MPAPAAADLVELWYPLAVGIARRYGKRWPWLADEFESVAAEALWKTAVKFGASGDVRFPGLVRRAVGWAVWRVIETEKRKNRTAFNDPPRIRNDEGEELDPLDLVAGTEPGPELLAEVRDLLDQLTPTQRERLTRHFLNGDTCAEIAKAECVTRSAVYFALNRALDALRAAG